MKLFVVLTLCFLATAYCQVIRPGHAAGEVGVPEFDEIKVESVLTVRSKGSRTGKSASDAGKQAQNNSETAPGGVRVSRKVRSPELREELFYRDAQDLIPINVLTRSIGLRDDGPRFRREAYPMLIKSHRSPEVDSKSA